MQIVKKERRKLLTTIPEFSGYRIITLANSIGFVSRRETFLFSGHFINIKNNGSFDFLLPFFQQSLKDLSQSLAGVGGLCTFPTSHTLKECWHQHFKHTHTYTNTYTHTKRKVSLKIPQTKQKHCSLATFSAWKRVYASVYYTGFVPNRAALLYWMILSHRSYNHIFMFNFTHLGTEKQFCYADLHW